MYKNAAAVSAHHKIKIFVPLCIYFTHSTNMKVKVSKYRVYCLINT